MFSINIFEINFRDCTEKRNRTIVIDFAWIIFHFGTGATFARFHSLGTLPWPSDIAKSSIKYRIM